MPSQEDDFLLLKQLLERDESALESLHDRYSSLLYSVALRIMGDPASAEEVTQDTFFQLWRNARQFDSTRGSLVGWLLTITRNRAISRLRHERLFNPEPLEDNSVLPQHCGFANALQVQIARELVSSALDALPATQRHAIMLAYFEGLTGEEIALHTGTPLGTTKTRLRSALTTMRRCLSDAPEPVASPGPPPPTDHATTVRLEDILITNQLCTRPCRPRIPDDGQSLRTLVQAAAVSPAQLVNCFLQLALNLCQADTAGLSFLDSDSNGGQLFRWTHLKGRLEQHVGGTTPRNFSPCGVTLDRDCPQLFSYPGRYFEYFNQTGIPIVEGLVIPFHVGTETEGTVWIVSHTKGPGFDSEDVRIMTQLTEFAACALHVTSLNAAEGHS
jgi:RNA polymerase sigma factor (sigma-70 family)